MDKKIKIQFIFGSLKETKREIYKCKINSMLDILLILLLICGASYIVKVATMYGFLGKLSLNLGLVVALIGMGALGASLGYLLFKKVALAKRDLTYAKTVLALQQSEKITLYDTNAYIKDDKVVSTKVFFELDNDKRVSATLTLSNPILVTEFDEKYMSENLSVKINLVEKSLIF